MSPAPFCSPVCWGLLSTWNGSHNHPGGGVFARYRRLRGAKHSTQGYMVSLIPKLKNHILRRYCPWPQSWGVQRHCTKYSKLCLQRAVLPSSWLSPVQITRMDILGRLSLGWTRKPGYSKAGACDGNEFSYATVPQFVPVRNRICKRKKNVLLRADFYLNDAFQLNSLKLLMPP